MRVCGLRHESSDGCMVSRASVLASVVARIRGTVHACRCVSGTEQNRGSKVTVFWTDLLFVVLDVCPVHHALVRGSCCQGHAHGTHLLVRERTRGFVLVPRHTHLAGDGRRPPGPSAGMSLDSSLCPCVCAMTMCNGYNGYSDGGGGGVGCGGGGDCRGGM